jgi:hypothetical protein
MNVWNKIKGYIIAFFTGIGALFVAWAIWNNRDRYGASQGPDQGIDNDQRELGESIGRQGTEIDDSIERIERLETVLGDGKARERETESLVRQSQDVRGRATDFLRSNPD